MKRFEEKWLIQNGYFHAGHFQHTDMLEVGQDNETDDVWLTPLSKHTGKPSVRNAVMIKVESIDDLISALQQYKDHLVTSKTHCQCGHKYLEHKEAHGWDFKPCKVKGCDCSNYVNSNIPGTL